MLRIIQSHIVLLIDITLGVALAIALASPRTTYVMSLAAQNSCADPFGNAILEFSPSHWTKTDFCLHSIDLGEVRSGGPPPDGIPPIDDPQFESVTAAAEWLAPQSPVIVVVVNDHARAYPLAVMIWHEIVNDVIADLPVAVTYCPLCNASLVFDRRVDGSTLRFGVSGNLRNSDMIMWDDASQSWWQQFTGEGIVGTYTGRQLTMLPSLVTSFDAFSQRYPNGDVLSRDTGFSRSYGSNPYVGYDSSSNLFLFDGGIDPRLPATERVLAGLIGGEPIAYPFSTLREQVVINDTVGGIDVVAFWQPGATSALDLREIDESRDVGMAALYSRRLDGEVLTFALDDVGMLRDEQTGSQWNVFGEATEGQFAGRHLEQQFAAPDLWFAWVAFQPDTRIYGNP